MHRQAGSIGRADEACPSKEHGPRARCAFISVDQNAGRQVASCLDRSYIASTMIHGCHDIHDMFSAGPRGRYDEPSASVEPSSLRAARYRGSACRASASLGGRCSFSIFLGFICERGVESCHDVAYIGVVMMKNDHNSHDAHRPTGSTGRTEGAFSSTVAPWSVAVNGTLALPAVGSVVRIDGERYRVLAHIDGRLLLAHVANGSIYLQQEDTSGDLRIPPVAVWQDLVRSGRAEPVPSRTVASDPDPPVPDTPTEKVGLQCDLLDRAGVANGAKAMAIWLHANWGPSLEATYGPHDSVHTLRRWRRLRRKGGTK
jgi:hypothetical protein